MKQIKEKILIQRIQKDHDTDAYAKLYDEYVSRLYRFIFLKVSDKREAEDLTSELFLRTWQYLTSDKKRTIESVSGLLYKIARNLIIDHYRERASAQTCAVELADKVPDNSENDRDRIHAAVDVHRVTDTMKKMKREYQEVILLRHVEELSLKEIAIVMEKGQTNVRVTLHRAMKVLKRMLREAE